MDKNNQLIKFNFVKEKNTIDYSEIKEIKTSVGGYFGGYYKVSIEIATGKVTWKHSGGGENEKKFEKSLKKEEIDQFIKELKSIKILDWYPEYVDIDICDGTQWSLNIITENKLIKKYGDNKFPKNFKKFCKVIEAVTNQEFH